MTVQAKIPDELERRNFELPAYSSRVSRKLPSANDRVVTLAFLSPDIASRLIAENLAQDLHFATGSSVLLVELEFSESELSLRDWPSLQSQVNGEFAFQHKLNRMTPGFNRLKLQATDDPPVADHIAGWLAHLSRHFRYVLLHAGAQAPASLLAELTRQSHRSFLFLTPTTQSLYQRELLLRDLHALPHSDAGLKTILCLPDSEPTVELRSLVGQMAGSLSGCIHHCPAKGQLDGVSGWPDKVFHSDIRRIAREIGRCRVGLALSSGGARGLSHIGVIQALEEAGIEVDVVAGCSMGSYVGAVWAYGYDGAFMEKLAREVEGPWWSVLSLIDPFILPRQGFLRGEKVKSRLKKSIGDAHFFEMIRPLRIVATNLNTLEREVFSSGEVAEAVLASAAIPGICAPIDIKGETYMDGGIADPLPVDVLTDMGIERIIAVNTIPTPAYLRCRLEMEREQTALSGRKPSKVKAALNKYLNYFAPGNILDTLMRTFNGAQMRVAEYSCRYADIVLRPLAFDSRWHDFRHPGKYIALGRRVTEDHLNEIKSLVNRKETHHEPQESHHEMGAVV